MAALLVRSADCHGASAHAPSVATGLHAGLHVPVHANHRGLRLLLYYAVAVETRRVLFHPHRNCFKQETAAWPYHCLTSPYHCKHDVMSYAAVGSAAHLSAQWCSLPFFSDPSFCNSIMYLQ